MESIDGGAGKPRFICEYTYTDDLIRDFARMQASGKRRGVLLICGLILVAVGSLWLFEPQPLHWAGIAPIALGIFCIWFRSNTWRSAARDMIALMEGDEEASGGRWRHVEIDDEGMTVRARDGREQRYDFADLTNFECDELMYVAIFGRHGVAIPLGSFVSGDAAGLGALLTEKHFPAGSMGPDTPNR